MLQEHVKTTKTDKTRFFFARKRRTWYPTNNYYLMSHFSQPNIERKNYVWTTKYGRLSEMCFVQHVEMKCVFTFPPMKLVSTTVKSAKPAATFWIFLSRTKNRQLCCLAVTVHIVLQKRRVAATKKKNHLHFWRNFSANRNQTHPNLNQKRLKWVQIWNKRIRFLLVDDLSNIFILQFISFSFNLLSTATQLTFNFQKTLIFSVSNDGIQWTLDFAPDSVTIAVTDLDQKITISSQEIHLAAWKLLLSQRQDFLDNHLPRVPITQNQEGTMEMKDEVLSIVGAQDLHTSSCQVSDLKDMVFNWEISQLDMDALFRPGIGTPFFSNYIWGFIDWGISWKPHCVGRRGRQGACSSTSINTRVCQTHGTAQAAEMSRFWNEKRKCTRLCLKKIVSIGITVFVF